MSQAVHSLEPYLDFLLKNNINAYETLDGSCILCKFAVEKHHIKIRIKLTSDFPNELPEFHLVDRLNYNSLAHIGWGSDGYAPICIGDSEAFSLNYLAPELVLLESLKHALDLVSKVLLDDEFNNHELLKEFGGIWRFHADSKKKLVCLSETTNGFQQLRIKSAVSKESGNNLDDAIIALSESNTINNDNLFIEKWNDKRRRFQSVGISLQINSTDLILPPAPDENIIDWWAHQLSKLSPPLKKSLRTFARRNKAKDFYLVFHTKVNEQPLWFCIHCTTSICTKLPLHENFLSQWQCTALNVEPIASSSLLYRSGADNQLNKSSVCIVGCGSVGGYIADMLASTGVGNLTLHDPDIFKPENLHRHYLPAQAFYYHKTTYLKYQLERSYPFISVDSGIKKLQMLKDIEFLQTFDLIVLATGNVTQEKVFTEWLLNNGVSTPSISAWNEALGIGGHAVLSSYLSKGCLLCTYIDPVDGYESLNCNLNFVSPSQQVMRNYAGCGTEFLPYSNIDSIQTATNATRLALLFLQDKLNDGHAITWRGDEALAKVNNIELTHRYYNTKTIMTPYPIANNQCEICSRYA